MVCLVCIAIKDKNVPLLKCGHYVCPLCYCNLKSNNVNNCACGEKLIRKYKKLI